MSPVRRETRPDLPRGRTARLSTSVTPAQAADCERSARIAGYGSTSEWIAAVLAREVELLEWSAGGAGSEPTPVPDGRPILPTYPPPPPDDPEEP